MMKRTSWAVATLLAAGIVSISGLAAASSHREAPAIGDDPAADNTDLYAWVDASGNNLVILANYVPLEEPAGGPNFHKFADDVLYEIHIVRGGTDLKDALKYQIKFTSPAYDYKDPTKLTDTPAGGNEFFYQVANLGKYQTYTVTKLEGATKKDVAVNQPVAPANIGPRTCALIYNCVAGDYESFATGGTFMKDMGAEGKVWAGPRDDGFYVDLGAVFDLAGICPAGTCTAHDNVAGYNTHTIALQIPIGIALNKTVNKGMPDTAQTVGVWASASRRKTRILTAKGTTEGLGPWTQVSRLGIPLINEAVIGLQDKDLWNRLKPSDDLTYFAGYFLNPILVRDAVFAGFYGVGGALAPCNAKVDALKANRADIIDIINLKNVPTMNAHAITSIGDVLRVDLGIASGFPNGRALVPDSLSEQADVTDIALGLLLTGLDPTCLPPAGGVVPDGVGANDKKYLPGFPYLASPWDGFADGHNSHGTR